jgi:hypothetical protein
MLKDLQCCGEMNSNLSRNSWTDRLRSWSSWWQKYKIRAPPTMYFIMFLTNNHICCSVVSNRQIWKSCTVMNFGFHKRWGISWTAEQQTAFQGLCSMQLVIYYLWTDHRIDNYWAYLIIICIHYLILISPTRWLLSIWVDFLHKKNQILKNLHHS